MDRESEGVEGTRRKGRQRSLRERVRDREREKGNCWKQGNKRCDGPKKKTEKYK